MGKPVLFSPFDPIKPENIKVRKIYLMAHFYILYLYPKNVAKDYLLILKFDNLKKDR